MIKKTQGFIKSLNIVIKVATTERQPERLQHLLFKKIGKKLPQILTIIKSEHQVCFR